MGAVFRGVAAWVIGAVVAVAVGMFALSRIGYGLASDTVQPPSPPAAVGPVPPPAGASMSPLPTFSPEPSRTPSDKDDSPKRPPVRRTVPPAPPAPPSPSGVERSFSSPGGSAVVRCEGSKARILIWSPQQGFHAETPVRRGPATIVSVEFEGNEGNERKVLLSARCVNGKPDADVNVSAERDDD